jgi:ankyrin repeat protein
MKKGFMKAIDSKDAGVVKLFMESGMGPDTTVSIKELKIPAIFYALEKGNDLIAQLFIDRGAKLDISVKGVTVLMKAVEKASVDTLSLILKQNIDVNKPGYQGLTPLMLAIERNNSGAIWLLLQKGADINKADNNGITPLMRALRVGDTDIVRELIKKGADVNAVTKNGMKTTKHE